jgi:hypothetical protein
LTRTEYQNSNKKVATTRTEDGHRQNTRTVTKTVATTRTEDGPRQNTKTVKKQWLQHAQRMDTDRIPQQ